MQMIIEYLGGSGTSYTGEERLVVRESEDRVKFVMRFLDDPLLNSIRQTVLTDQVAQLLWVCVCMCLYVCVCVCGYVIIYMCV